VTFRVIKGKKECDILGVIFGTVVSWGVFYF